MAVDRGTHSLGADATAPDMYVVEGAQALGAGGVSAEVIR
jgi:hypothetical protein